ncbi:MAG: DUF2336 domain-containing protein [Alphaproteobacteria bacterium]
MAKKPALKLRDHGAPDLDALFDLARDKSAAGRRAIFNTVRDLFFEGEEGALSDRERALMGEILHKLVHDFEITLRKDLAERMAARSDAPLNLTVALANDEIEVAHPILLHSTVLHDTDLVEIVRQRTQAHQITIARRKVLSEDVSQALVETGDTDVITALIKNGDAQISRSLMEYLVAESKRVDTFQNPLVQRRDLPADLARKMYWWVSAALRQHIVDNFAVDPTLVDDTIEEAVARALEKDRDALAKPSEAEAFVAQMAERGDLTEEFLVQTLRQGEVPLFEASFGNLTRLSAKLARRILYEPGGEGLAMTCRAIGLDRDAFATIYQLTREGVSSQEKFDPRELARVSAFFDRVSKEQAEIVLKRLRRDKDYLYALKQIEEASR